MMPHFANGTSPATTSPLLSSPQQQRDTAAAEEAASRSRRLTIKNRRKRYLDLHPEYFSGANLELAGLCPLTVS
jgi:hypothetical protein